MQKVLLVAVAILFALGVLTSYQKHILDYRVSAITETEFGQASAIEHREYLLRSCQSGVWQSFQNKFSIQAFNVGKNITDKDIGTHAYCSWTHLNGSPFGGFQKVYADSSNRWFVTNTRWGDYESGGTITVTCLNLPGAGI
ncbi:shufflon protein C [Citrobacter freundii]|uniref:shufflon protein C n=1 Tax=Citrobacter freundii TaxID=546 RepID=UPI001F31BF73|nr:shufflon protein C [Citrobacter freundii]